MSRIKRTLLADCPTASSTSWRARSTTSEAVSESSRFASPMPALFSLRRNAASVMMPAYSSTAYDPNAYSLRLVMSCECCGSAAETVMKSAVRPDSVSVFIVSNTSPSCGLAKSAPDTFTRSTTLGFPRHAPTRAFSVSNIFRLDSELLFRWRRCSLQGHVSLNSATDPISPGRIPITVCFSCLREPVHKLATLKINVESWC